MNRLVAESASRKATVVLAVLLGIVSSLHLYGQSCTAPGDAILGWWPGDVSAEDIANTNHGTMGGGASAGTPAHVLGGFHFDGTNGFVQIADTALLRPAQLSFEG